MKIKSIEQPLKSFKFFEEQIYSSVKSINVLKQFLLGVHNLCKKFGEDLQQLFLLLSVQVDDEETLVQNTAISNYILSISQIIRNRSDVLYEEAIEPFLQFESNYHYLNQTVTDQYKNLLSQMEAGHEVLKIKAVDYYEGKSKKQIFNNTNEASDYQYKLALNNMNTLWEQYFKDTPQYFENFQLNDESRLTVTEQTYCKFVEVLEYLFNQPAKNTIKKLKSSFQQQKQRYRMKDLYSDMTICNKKMIDFFQQPKSEIYISRDDYFRAQTALLLQAADQNKNQGLIEEDFKTIRQLLYKTIDSPSNIIYKVRIIPSFPFKERQEIIQFLRNEIKNKLLILESDFQQRLFKTLFIRMFKSYDQDYQNNQKYTLQLLQMMSLSLQLQNQFSIPILQEINQHCDILFSHKIWISIYNELTVNFDYQKLIIEIAQNYVHFNLCHFKFELPSTEIQQNNKFFAMFEDKARKISINETLTILDMLLISSNLNLQLASQIMIESVKANNMKLSTSIHYIDLQESNYMLRQIKPIKNIKIINEKQVKWKQLSIYCLIKSLKFLDFNSNYLNLICISKDLSKIIRKKMIQYYLSQNSPKILQFRVKLWSLLLESDVSYAKTQQEYMVSSRKLSREIERNIMVDIKRSFVSATQNREETLEKYQNKLESLLRLHAFDCPEVSYYQGMNMLMVFLLFVTDLNEEICFKLFRALLDKMLKDIFLEGLKSMRLQFYILERLIAIRYPSLYIHWRKLKIESPQFATAWYVTLFTHSIQLNEGQSNETCYEIFDLIVAKGWAGFYNAVLAMLGYYQQMLLELDFDETQKFLNHLARSSFNSINPIGKRGEFKDIKNLIYNNISKHLLYQIEKEYYELREKIDYINLHHL